MSLDAAQSEPTISTRRRRRRTDDIRVSILEAAAAEFGAKGFAGATTAAIAKRSGVAENQIFRHFTSKAELFKKAVFEPLNERFEEFITVQLHYAIQGDEPELVDRYISALSKFTAGQKRELLALVRSNDEDLGEALGIGKMGALDAFFRIGQALLTAKRGIRPDWDPRIVNRISFGAVLACVMFGDWLLPEDVSADEVSSVLGTFIMHGIDGARAQGG